MNCNEVTRLLALEDTEQRVDPARLMDHLNHCGACATQHPELTPLLLARPAIAPAAEPVSPRPARRILALTEIPWRTAGRVAVAALFVVGVILCPDSQPVTPEVHPSASQAEDDAASGGAIPFRPRPRARRHDVRTETTIHNGRRISSSLTHAVVTPALPRILQDR